MSESAFLVYKGIEYDPAKSPSYRRKIEVVPFNDELEYLQGLVGGYLEHFIIDEGLDQLHIDMWIDEEGKLKSDTKPSIALLVNGQLRDVILGNCVFSKYNDEGETLGLSVDEVNIVIGWLMDRDVIGLITGNDGGKYPVLAVDLV